MRKLNNKEISALHKLSEAESTFMECIDVIADSFDKDKDAFYFSALCSLSVLLLKKFHEDEMRVLARVYAHVMKFKKEGINNERFN